MFQLLFKSLALILCTTSAFAQSFRGPQSSAMGGAGRAAVAPGESAFLNPATVPHFQEYFASGFYSQSEHPLDGEAQQFGVLLSDGAPDRLFQGALGYVHSNLDPIGGVDITTQDIYVGVGGFVYRNISFGLQAHRLVFKQANVPTSTQFNGGAGVLWAYSKSLQFGLVASDILAPKDSVPLAARLSRTYAAGMSYNFENRFSFRFDLVRPTGDQNPDNETDIMTGFETEAMEFFAFRSGFRWNEAIGPERRVFTAGVGFKGPKLRADYGFEKDTKVAGGIRHSFDLWMSF